MNYLTNYDSKCKATCYCLLDCKWKQVKYLQDLYKNTLYYDILKYAHIDINSYITDAIQVGYRWKVPYVQEMKTAMIPRCQVEIILFENILKIFPLKVLILQWF